MMPIIYFPNRSTARWMPGAALAHVFGRHLRMQFDLGIERQKSEFGEGRIVCGVGHLNEQVPAPLSAVVGEVHCFGFLLVEDRMDRLAERTGRAAALPASCGMFTLQESHGRMLLIVRNVLFTISVACRDSVAHGQSAVLP